mmetsp:Transcript_71316/g.118131  ORF Transcript_71316/g.118131 Transcript_71316/m.118131 type:complete len:204 (-) Transcript_71316:556-1167(-)
MKRTSHRPRLLAPNNNSHFFSHFFSRYAQIIRISKTREALHAVFGLKGSTAGPIRLNITIARQEKLPSSKTVVALVIQNVVPQQQVPHHSFNHFSHLLHPVHSFSHFSHLLHQVHSFSHWCHLLRQVHSFSHLLHRVHSFSHSEQHPRQLLHRRRRPQPARVGICQALTKVALPVVQQWVFNASNLNRRQTMVMWTRRRSSRL